MAEAAVTFLLEKVEQIVKHYADLLGGAEDELEQLTDDLELLKSFLEDAGRQQQKDSAFRTVEKQIRRVVCQTEDIIDCCLTQAIAAKTNTKWYKKLSSLGKSVNLAEAVKSMREKVGPMIDRARTARGDGSSRGGEQPPTNHKPVRTIRKDNVVGFEIEEQTIINYLMEKREELDVISIIGMPGLGKTTLAWKIFHNSQIESKFATRIWVSVSQEFSKKEVFLNILKEFNKEDMSSLSEHQLFQEVRSKLETGKFLLVMDDVWSVESWNAIKDVLPKENEAGKVLITTRYFKVGVHANPSRPEPHKLDFLSDENSWKLLQLEVYGKINNNLPEDLEKMGKQIAKECGGLPLAILVIGGILMNHRTGTTVKILGEWAEVSENVSAYIRENIEKNEHYSISDVVTQSYNRLPDNLRECFLYLGVFPEDYPIPVRTLTHLWIAEGFIQDKGWGLERTAEENLSDLIDRNLVMVDKTTLYGKLKTCKLHDVIREFCKSKAGTGEQNLFQEIKKNKQRVLHPPISDFKNHRRISVNVHLPEFFHELNRGKIKGGYLRSFLYICKDPFTLENKYIFAIPESLHLLRVLDSKSFKFPVFPENVTNLIHLRYITLSCDNLSSIPESVSTLWSLQTLLVYTRSSTLQIKANIWKLSQLRHLMTKASIVLDMQKRRKGESDEHDDDGENLQTLSRLSPECCTNDIFNKACNLNKLGIRGRLAELDMNLSLEEMESLENLKLLNVELASDKPLHHLPTKNFFPNYPTKKKFFPKNIKKLTLSATHLKWEHMSKLGQLDTLEVLKLKDYAFIGHSWDVDGVFPRLQFLLIATSDLVNWEASSDINHFPGLSCLVLEQCKELEKIPKVLAKTLLTLEMKSINPIAINKAKEIGKEAVSGGFKLTIDHQLITLGK